MQKLAHGKPILCLTWLNLSLVMAVLSSGCSGWLREIDDGSNADSLDYEQAFQEGKPWEDRNPIDREFWPVLGFDRSHLEFANGVPESTWEGLLADSQQGDQNARTLLLLREYLTSRDASKQSLAIDDIIGLAKNRVPVAQYLVAKKLQHDSEIDALIKSTADLSETPSLIQSLVWLQSAADAGLTPAMSALGFAHCRGLGITADFDVGVEWYILAAADGDKFAIKQLMDLSNRGELEFPEPDIAQSWLNSLADDQDPIIVFFAAKLQLTKFLEQGEVSESFENELEDTSDEDLALNSVEHSFDEISVPPQVLERIERAAREGYPPACLQQYYFLTESSDGATPTQAAVKFLEVAADQGLLEAQLELVNYFSMLTESQDGASQKLEYWLTRAAALDGTEARTLLGEYYYDKGDIHTAFSHFLRATENGGLRGRYLLGRLLIEHSEEMAEAFQNNAKGEGLHQVRNAAERDLPEAQLFLAQYLIENSLAQSGWEEPRKWLLLAAQQDLSQAQLELGKIYWSGEGLKRPNHFAAVQWLERAAEQGELEAMKMLVEAYRSGQGTLPDPDRANELMDLVKEFSRTENRDTQ